MTSKNIFVLNGHPARNSISASLAEAYVTAAKDAGHDLRLTHIHDLQFDMDYGFGGYSQHKPLEPDLIAFQADIDWADHVVLLTPMWWGGLPAKLKGLIDRSFLPGWAFDPRKPLKSGLPAPLLKGRTARAIVTSDTPTFFFGLLYRKALLRQIQGQILRFVGLKPRRIIHFAQASHPKEGQIAKWIDQIAALGQRGG